VKNTVAPEYAETVALRALAWLMAEDDQRGAFINLSGLSPDDLRARAGTSEILLAVVDFVLGDDARVVAFCDSAGLRYDALMSVRSALPGGAEYNWT